MKEIGNIFKTKREEIGITIEEVGNDLDIDVVLIENLEGGNDKVFKDVLEVKKIIASYAKYLDLEEKKILEEYNDYLFEKTSKINQADIREKLNRVQKEPVQKQIKSPYTIEEKEQTKERKGIVLLFILVVILVILYFILKRLMIG